MESSQSPSHVPMGLPPYAIHDGSMSSSQSISSSNSGRDAETQEEGEAAVEGVAAGAVVLSSFYFTDRCVVLIMCWTRSI